MPYLGKPAGARYQNTVKDSFSGDGSTTAFTMSQTVHLVTDVEVFVDNVQQEPTFAYTISGTTLTFTEAPDNGTNNIYVIHRSGTNDSFTIQKGSSPTLGNLIIADAGTIGSASSTSAMAIASSGIVTFVDDINMDSDSAVIKLGADQDVTITHVADTGITLASGTNDTVLQINSNAADAGGAPFVILNRTSDSPADNDNGGLVRWDMENDNNQQFIAAAIMAKATDVSDGTEDANLQLSSMVAGTLTNGLIISGGRINSSAYSPAGSVVQVVQNATTGNLGTTSTSYVDVTNCTIDITCASTSNKVMAIYSAYASYTLVASTNVSGTTRILRDATQLVSRTVQVADGAGGIQGVWPMSAAYLDSPGSTSALTYKAQALVSDANSTFTNTQAWIILMEIQV